MDSTEWLRFNQTMIWESLTFCSRITRWSCKNSYQRLKPRILELSKLLELLMLEVLPLK
jgi:hypothetical protein